MPRLTKHPFTMIEILLALGVAAIGICSIMVLFPVGANASRDTAMETYCANATEELLHYYQRLLQRPNSNKWSTYITSNGIKDNSAESIDNYKLTEEDGKLVTKSGGSQWGRGTETAENDAKIIETNFPNLATTSGYAHAFLLTNLGNDASFSSSTTLADINWAAIIVITKHKVNLNGDKTALNNEAIVLQADVTWPAQADAANRKTVTYVLEVCKP